MTADAPIAYEKARSRNGEEGPMALAVTPSQLVPRRHLPVDRRPHLVYLARLSEGSRRTMRDALDTIARLASDGLVDADGIDWSLLRYQHAQLIRTRLADRLAPATVNKHLAALRGVAEEAWRLGLMESDDQRRIEKLEGVRGARLLRGRSLAPGELASLAKACADGTPAAARDAGMLAVLYETGMRRAELVAIDLADYDASNGDLRIRHGKGDKERLVHVGDGARTAVDAWLSVRGPEPGPLFVPVNKGGRLSFRRLTTQAVYNMVRERGRVAGLRAFSPHDLRRTFAGDHLDAGTDPFVVAQLLGHARIETTLRYDRRPEAARRAAARRLRFPYIAPR